MKAKIFTVLALLLLGGMPLLAAVDAFIWFENVQGESTKPGHQGWIEIESFSWGVTNAGSMAHGTGGGEGKATFHDLSFVHRVDKASPALMKATASGKHFPNVKLEAGGQHYQLQDVIITSVQPSSKGDGTMMETVKLNFAHDALHPDPANARAAVVTQPNATFTGGITGNAMLQSLKLNGQTQAIIVVCDVNGGQAVGALQHASQSRQAMPTLTIRATRQQASPVTFTFTNVLVSSYSAAPGGCPQVTLNFARFDGPAGGF